jgi:hypothetical protein
MYIKETMDYEMKYEMKSFLKNGKKLRKETREQLKLRPVEIFQNITAEQERKHKKFERKEEIKRCKHSNRLKKKDIKYARNLKYIQPKFILSFDVESPDTRENYDILLYDKKELKLELEENINYLKNLKEKLCFIALNDCDEYYQYKDLELEELVAVTELRIEQLRKIMKNIKRM